MTKKLPQAIQHRDEIIKRISEGEYAGVVAADLGISPQALSNHLSTDPYYQAAREQGMERRLKKFEKAMEDASDGLAVARARELMSHQRWRAEREFGHRWRASGNQVNIVADGPVAVQVVSFAELQQPQPPQRTIEHDGSA